VRVCVWCVCLCVCVRVCVWFVCIFVCACVHNITEDVQGTEVGKGNSTTITVIVHTEINLNDI